jgi:DNA polymerase III subunit delta'
MYAHNLPPIDRSAIGQKLAQGNHPDVLWVMPTYNYQGKLLSATEAAAAGVKRKAPPQIRIEQVREIGRFLARPPLQASRSIVIIEDAQTMAEGAANALLKTLEEPGRATIIVLSTSIDELLPTIVSRCQQIPFRRLDRAIMTEILDDLDRQDLLGQTAIIGLAQGSPGAAIESWERLQSIDSELLDRAISRPSNRRQALELARDLDRDLDTEAQLWLLDYLQYTYWHKYRNPQAISNLELARTQLLAYVQPRLVWECTLMQSIAPR